MNIPPFRCSILIGAFFALTLSTQVVAQAGLNGGKPIITYNTHGPISIQTQSPPAFPGGEERLAEFIRENIGEAEEPVKLGKKTWITASLDGQGQLVSLVPSFSNDPSLKEALARIGPLMPRWTPGQINQKGVETRYQFLLRR